ncbi:MAG: CHAT domain-containing tetratricopeptide repeat protein [Rhodomicrobium sp.]
MTWFGGVFLAFALFGVAAASPSGALPAEVSAKLEAQQKKATSLYQNGFYREALQASQEALKQTIEEFGPDHEQTGIQAFGVGYAAEAAGDLAEAERRYADSVRIREKVYGQDSAGVATALERLARVILDEGRPAEAEALFLRELKIWRDTVGEHAIAADAYAGLGAVNAMRGDYAAALSYYRKAVERLASQTAAQATAKSVIEADIKRHRDVFIGLARAAAGVKRQPGADQAALMDETFAAGQRAWATSAASALAKMTARLKAGETELGRSIRLLETLSGRILALNDEDMKALAAWSKVQQAGPAYQQALEAFRGASIASAKDNAPVVKRQRELVDRLQDVLKRCPPAEMKPGCEASESERNGIAKELGALSQVASQGARQINELSHRMQAEEQKLPGYREFSVARAARIDQSQRLEEELAVTRAAVVQRFPDFLSLAEPEPLSVAEARQLLHPDEALVAILTGAKSGLVWVVTRERADWAEIEAGDAALAAEVSALRRGLDPTAEGNSDSVQPFDAARSHRLYKLLLERFSPILEGKRHLLVVPAGPLSSLPFQVLVTEPPREGVPSQWLIRRHALSVLPSVQSLSALRRFAASGIAAKPFFGMGDPIFGDRSAAPDSARGVKRAPPPSLAEVYRNGAPDLRLLAGLAPLPETAAELEAVARTLNAQKEDINLREAATETRVKSAPLKDYRILHFATHGLVAGDLTGLDEPALVLTLPSVPTEADDGLLTASEVATLQLNADWVVLSACNTASGDKIGADALSGLARAFFYAGARALLVSHWPVNSQAAVDLTTRTFAALAAEPNLSRAEAFQRAMLRAIDEGQTPDYWAPFVIVGEGGAGIRPGR